MSKGRILVVEDELDISNMLRIYFTGQGYTVEVAGKGSDALAATRKNLPNLIMLDINLPDMSGYDVCRELRTAIRTSHIPIIFLTQKDERADKIIGLELGADDYVTKPFDIEELKLRVQNAISAVVRQRQVNPISNLPMGNLIEDHLRQLMRENRDWAYIDLKINDFEAFSEIYGWAAGDEVIRATALMLGEMIEKSGTPEDYLGHPGRDNFVIITHSSDPDQLTTVLADRFATEIKQHYSFIDRERGYMMTSDASAGEHQVDLMTLAHGSVGTRTHQFSDIREVTELAAENRRRRRGGSADHPDTDADSSILSSW